MRVYNGNDITGDNAVHKLSDSLAAAAYPLKARWIHFFASGGSPQCAIGTNNVSLTSGGHLNSNTVVIYPPIGSDPNVFYDLTELFAYVATGTTLTWSYGY